MRAVCCLVLSSLALPAAAAEQDCIFVSLPDVVCDGKGHAANVSIPNKRPLAVTSAFYQLHTGTWPILEIGGLIDVALVRKDRSVVLVGGMNRHGAARWTHDPPVIVREGETIVASYGCLVPRSRVREMLNVVRGWLGRTKDIGGMTPNVQVCWSE
jgi:hypothetical protein